MYLVAGAFTLCYWTYLYFSSFDKLILEAEVKEQSSIIRRRIAEYLPGYY